MPIDMWGDQLKKPHAYWTIAMIQFNWPIVNLANQVNAYHNEIGIIKSLSHTHTNERNQHVQVNTNK